MGVVDESVSSVELASNLIRKLGEAYVKLEAHKDALPSGKKLLWKDIESHFHQMESVLKKKLEDLKAKEEEFTKKEAEICSSIAEREAAVVAKEQDLLDRVQDLKDAAVAAIFEARANHVAEPAAPAIVTNGNENKVSSSLDAENAPLCVPEEGHPYDVVENAEALDLKAKRYSALIRSCELMDANGLLNLITENQNHLSDVCSELSVALSSATEPARLVLELLEGIFPLAKNTNQGKFTKQGVNCNEALKGLQQSCWVVTQAWAAMLAKAGPITDYYLSHEIIGQAKAIADEWMPKLSAVEGNDAGNENSLEIGGFLWLLATFRIGSEFDQDELCKLVLAVAHRHREATELCLSLGLTDKMPGIIETLIDTGKLSDAVHLIQAFQLSDTYPPVPLLKEYLKVVRRNSQGKGSRGDASSQVINNTRELTALEAVVKCIKDYNLQEEYPLFQLEGRIAQLLRSKAMDPKRIRGEKKYIPPNLQVHITHQPKKAKLNGGYRGTQTHTFGASSRTGGITTARQTQVPYQSERPSAYAGTPQERHPHPSSISYGYSASNQSSYPPPDPQQRYTHATSSTYSYPAASSTYSYPAASQTGYAAPPSGDQKSYYYVLDHTTNTAGYGNGAPAYTTQTGSGAPGYVSHTGGGPNTSYSHQSYM